MILPSAARFTRRVLLAAVVVAGLCLAWPAPAAAPPQDPGAAFTAAAPSYETWKSRCAPLPSNRLLAGRMPPASQLPFPSYEPVSQAVSAALEQFRTGALARSNRWHGTAPDAGTFLDVTRAYFKRPAIPFKPFAIKRVVPAGTEVFFHGDLHGDIHSLMACLEKLNSDGHLRGFEIARTNFLMVFLGDYTDRGSYGIEVFYTLLRLKLANPDRVILVRGNHEDIALTARYGFLAEGRAKYGAAFDPVPLSRIYDFLPAVLYLGSGGDFLQCNHGGMEPGFNPADLLQTGGPERFQLLGQLRQRTFAEQHPEIIRRMDPASQGHRQSAWLDFTPETPTTPSVLGFMWNDFTVFARDPAFAVDPGRAFVYGEQIVGDLLQAFSRPGARIRAVFRAHQHSTQLNPLMRRLLASRGVFRHWQSGDSETLREAPIDALGTAIETRPERAIPDHSVWTFNVSPDSHYGVGCGFDFDTLGLLTTGATFEIGRAHV